MKSDATIRCSVPADQEPKLEGWLDRRDIPFEVSPSKAGRLIVHANFGACTDGKERKRLEGMYRGVVLKIPEGRILKNKGDAKK